MFKLIGITVIGGGLLLAPLLANAPPRPLTFRSICPLGDKMPPERFVTLVGDLHRRALLSACEKLDASTTDTHRVAVGNDAAVGQRKSLSIARLLPLE